MVDFYKKGIEYAEKYFATSIPSEIKAEIDSFSISYIQDRFSDAGLTAPLGDLEKSINDFTRGFIEEGVKFENKNKDLRPNPQFIGKKQVIR